MARKKKPAAAGVSVAKARAQAKILREDVRDQDTALLRVGGQLEPLKVYKATGGRLCDAYGVELESSGEFATLEGRGRFEVYHTPGRLEVLVPARRS